MFAQINKETVIQCYRANEIYPREKKTKKVQKDLLRKTASISPQEFKQETAYTTPLEPFENTNAPSKLYEVSKKKKKKVLFKLCECYDFETDKMHKPETWESITNYYGNADTTEIWADSENQIPIRERYKNKHPEINPKPRDYKKHKRRSKIHKKRGNRLKSHISNDNDEKIYKTPGNPGPLNTSVISLFRTENTNKKSKFEKRSKSKEERPEEFKSFEENCPDIECAEEAKKNKNYKCKCNVKGDPKNELHLITKELSPKFLSINSMVKLKDKFLCVCHKYSQNVINTQFRPNNPMEPNTGVINKAQLSRKRNSKQRKNVNDIVIKKEHEGEQTGEPFFEIQVNPRDMCVLNPTEIKQSVLKYGRPEKNEPVCICPSRGRLSPSEVCKSGLCKKAYKNKQVNFNCWCEKKIAECGDATCDVIGIDHKRKKQKIKVLTNEKVNKPLLEVQLDMDKMCVVNPREIEDKIMNNITVNEICSSGVCREAALRSKTPYFCKCIRKKMSSDITECTEDSCTDATKKKKSKFSLLCTRICSKSENWLHRCKNESQKRIKRRSFYEISPNLRKGKISSQLDNLRKDKFEIKQEIIPKLNVRQKDVNKHDLKDNNYVVPTQRQRELKHYNATKVKHVGISNEFNYNTKDVICACAHKCECDMDNIDTDMNKIELKNTKYKKKQEKNKLAQRRRNKRIHDRNFQRDLKRRTKLDKKGEKRSAKERLREIKDMQKKMNEEPLDINFCTAILLGIVKIGFRTLIGLITVIVYMIKHPKKSYLYVMDRLRDPEGTYMKLKKWFLDAITIKRLQMANTIRGSDTLTILADHFLDTPFYQSFANKGRTKQEQINFEQKSKARKRRIRKREQQAIHSCRHMLLTTLRQTPCLWVYHICPNFYPQCLSLLAFMQSFSRILLFLVAFACWTPCILSFELCRAFLCCFLCTG